MIGQLSVLLKVKKLKETQAFRELEVKRAHVTAAEAALREAEEIVRESARTLPAREAAIYDAILRKVVDLGEIDAVKGKVLALEKDHQALVSEAERAAHVLARAEKERDEALARHRQTVKDRDKYVILTDEMKAEFAAMMEAREEVEIEDTFSVKRKRPA